MDKKNLIQSIAAGTAATVLLSGCTVPFNPKQNLPVAIYGPPEVLMGMKPLKLEP